MSIYGHTLRIFVNVVENRSFSRASQKMFLTQPSISAAIKKLESYYGVSLIKRGHNKMELTVAGDILYRHAKHILHDIALLDRDMAEFIGEKKKGVSIGVSGALFDFFMPDFLRSFYLNHTMININVIQLHCEDIVDCIMGGTCDMGLLCRRIIREDMHDDLTFEDFFTEPLYIVAPAGHPLTMSGGRCHIEELLDKRFIFREETSGCMEAFSAWLGHFGLTLSSFKDHIVIGHIRSIKNMMAESNLLSIMAESWIREELCSGKYKVIAVDGPRLTISYYIAYLSKREKSRNFDMFYNFLKSYREYDQSQHSVPLHN
ncbi:LysR family transcriptional regulator [bacterium]|nr:LysR family transcriptional regulator [bacterium]